MDKKELRQLLQEALDGDIDASHWDPGATIGMPTFITSSSIHTPSSRSSRKAPDAEPVSHFVNREDEDAYSVIEVLGRGGLGVVYRARQEALGRDVAIKSIRKKRLDDAIANEAFLSEAVITGLLDHPNIVPVHDLIRTPTGETAIAMKLVNGISWMDILHPKTEEARQVAAEFTLARHLDILLSVGNAVAFAHSKGIIHRDLKPSNVMVGEFGEVVVMDWGMAVVWDADRLGTTDGDSVRPRLRESITHPGGSPGYMAPEMAQSDGSLLGPATDVYLLGSILYEVLTGRRPHDGKSLYQVVKAAFQSKPPPFPDDVPEGLKAVCRTAMARKINERFESVGDFQKAIREYLRHRESHALVAEADGHRARFEALDLRKRLGHEPTRLAGYAALADAIAGYRQALVLHSGNEAARQRGEETRFLYARTAFSAGDYGLARTQLEGLQTEEARTLDGEVQAAIDERERTQRSARFLRTGLIAVAAVLLVGLAVGIVVIYSEKTRADRLAITAQENLRTARINAAEAEDQARRREKAAAEAAENARRVQQEARAKLEALEDREREKERADAMAAKARERSIDAEKSAREAARQSRRAEDLLEEAKIRASEAEANAEKAREAQRLAAESLRQVRAEAKAKERALTEVQWLADVLRLQNLESRAKVLLAADNPDLVALDRWLAEAGALCAREPDHTSALEEIEAEVAEASGAGSKKQRELLTRWRGEIASLESELATAIEDFHRENLEDRIASTRRKVRSMRRKLPKPRRLSFPNEDLRWRHEVLTKLVKDLQRFAEPGRGTRAAMERFTERAHKQAPKKSARGDGWHGTLRAIEKSRRYRGLQLAPQPGLAPLGRDPFSGLFEFLHLASHNGPIPTRDGQGRLVLSPDAGIILVLVPPGSITRPTLAQPEDREVLALTSGPRRAPRVALDAFLAAKHELTRAQWYRIERQVGHHLGDTRPSQSMLPATGLDTDDLATLNEVGLGVPTVAQWSYLASAGRNGNGWSPGARARPGAAKAAAGRMAARSTLSPVGRSRANPFGLHDTLGNAAEWCRGRQPRLLGAGTPAPREDHESLATAVETGEPAAAGVRPVVHPVLRDGGGGWRSLRSRLEVDPRYADVKPSRLKSLLPLGPDPDSGLEEFLHLPSHGEAPRTRDNEGRFPVGEETGLVFVLVPRGSFFMGSETTDPLADGYDTEARPDETPRHEVRLGSFLIAKHEMSRGQWRRLIGRAPPSDPNGEVTPAHPVSGLSRLDCDLISRHGLALPTEAQWEYAARGGTASIWWWDLELTILRDHLNLADLSHSRLRPEAGSEGWNDGWALSAPCGSSLPNPFGLHEVAGNLSEWVRDTLIAYDRPPRGPEALRRAARRGQRGVARGGSYAGLLDASRLAARHAHPGDHRAPTVGLRPLFPLHR